MNRYAVFCALLSASAAWAVVALIVGMAKMVNLETFLPGAVLAVGWLAFIASEKHP